MKKLMTMVAGAVMALSATCEMTINPKLPMSFGVDSKGGNRFVGEFRDIQLSFGGRKCHSGPAKAGDRVAEFPSFADAAKGMRFSCRFVTKDASKSQRLLDNVTPGKGDGFLVDVYQGKFRAVISGVCAWSHPTPIQSNRETFVEIEITGDDEKVTAFTRLLKPYGIEEVIRTGLIALERGDHTIYDYCEEKEYYGKNLL